jgi:hypothetical protein
VLLICTATLSAAPHIAGQARTRLAIVGLDHDHVWGLLALIANEPDAELVAIAEAHAELVEKAKGKAPAGVKFFSDYIPMLDEVKPEAVIATTANHRHVEILRACAQRKMHNDKPIEGPVSAALNVGVNEIIDAAKESIRTDRAVAMPAP